MVGTLASAAGAEAPPPSPAARLEDLLRSAAKWASSLAGEAQRAASQDRRTAQLSRGGGGGEVAMRGSSDCGQSPPKVRDTALGPAPAAPNLLFF